MEASQQKQAVVKPIDRPKKPKIDFELFKK